VRREDSYLFAFFSAFEGWRQIPKRVDQEDDGAVASQI
jgi:hypothetical protein